MGKLVSLFEGSVQDVVKTLLVKGYSREQEGNADLSALTIMQRLGYDPNGLSDLLERLGRESSGGQNQGIFATHPGMKERGDQARSMIASNSWTRKSHPERNRRFQQVMQSMR